MLSPQLARLSPTSTDESNSSTVYLWFLGESGIKEAGFSYRIRILKMDFGIGLDGRQACLLSAITSQKQSIHENS